jgi:hypothetical protein
MCCSARVIFALIFSMTGLVIPNLQPFRKSDCERYAFLVAASIRVPKSDNDAFARQAVFDTVRFWHSAGRWERPMSVRVVSENSAADLARNDALRKLRWALRETAASGSFAVQAALMSWASRCPM